MNIGDAIPLYLQLSDYNTAKYVKAVVRDEAGTQISGSPAILLPVATGLYANTSLRFPSTTFITCQYLVYDDSGYTVLSTSEGGDLDTFFQTEGGGGGGGGGPVPSNLIGVIDGEDGCCPVNNAIQDTVVCGSDRTLTIRLIQGNNGEPFDLTGTTNIQCRFLNADGSVLALNMTDLGAPVAIVLAQAGKLTCLLSRAETLLLAVGSPVRFSVVVTQSVGVVVANFATQLAVQAEAV